MKIIRWDYKTSVDEFSPRTLNNLAQFEHDLRQINGVIKFITQAWFTAGSAGDFVTYTIFYEPYDDQSAIS